MCWDLTTGATVERKCHRGGVHALCYVGDHVLVTSERGNSAQMCSLPNRLLHCFIFFCCQCNPILVVELVTQCTFESPRVAAAYGSSVFFMTCRAVMAWDTETGAVSKLVEHKSEYLSIA